METSLVGPLLAQIGLAFVVLLYMFSRRVPALNALNPSPEDLQNKGLLDSLPAYARNPSDNFKNLFEVPVLFYVLALIMMAAGLVDSLAVVLAWAFVGLRALHSLVQCTYNNVMHRFLVYMAANLVLIALYVKAVLLYCAG